MSGRGFEDLAEVLKKGLLEALSALRSYGLSCSASVEELVEYLSGPSYEDDRIGLSEIASNPLLLLHEVAEMCVLKSMGYTIDRETVVRAYPDTYRAHLLAMEIELLEATRLGDRNYVARRCADLESYLSDPALPSNCVEIVKRLMDRFCREHTA